MAARALISLDDLLCPLCCGVFNVPVELKCDHNSCKACLQNFWEWEGSRKCPVCGTLSVSERPPINLTLKIAADSFQNQRIFDGLEEICHLHNEKLKLFCHKDKMPICLVCQASRQHRTHECSPVEEAAVEKKREVTGKLESLQKHMNILNKTKDDWDGTVKYIQRQADQTENQIKEEFKKMHCLLWDEEKVLLLKLRQEEATKTQVMNVKLESMKEMITELADLITKMEKAVREEDVLFLQDYKQIDRAKYTIKPPECIRDILIDAAKYLASLKFGIWKKMVDLVQYVPFNLDPNTAQSNLSFSDEYSCVQYGSKHLVPDNPERCNSRIAVLAAKGFTSGKHSWTIEVGHSRDWYIGVARESIKRKSTIFLNPSEGFWVIGLCNGDAYWAQTSPTRTKIAVKKKPTRITVELDYDKGKVVFIKTSDSTVMHTFKDTFMERIFPYFSPGMDQASKSGSSLTICPMTISIDVQ